MNIRVKYVYGARNEWIAFIHVGVRLRYTLYIDMWSARKTTIKIIPHPFHCIGRRRRQRDL